MNKIIITPNFKKGYKKIAKKYPSFRTDIAAVTSLLIENASQGVQIMPSIWKIRVSISGKSKGKSGGARVIYYAHIDNETIFLLYVYDKSEIANIEDSEIKAFLTDLLESLESEKED